MKESGASDVGRVWRSADGSIEIETVRIGKSADGLAGLYAALKQPAGRRTVSASQIDGRFFTIAGIESGRHYVMRFAGAGADLRGFTVSYDDAAAARMAPYVTVATQLFDPFMPDGSDQMDRR